MANLKEVVSVYQNLTQEWNRKPSNLDKCGELLTQLKVYCGFLDCLVQNCCVIASCSVTLLIYSNPDVVLCQHHESCNLLVHLSELRIVAQIAHLTIYWYIWLG